MKNWPATRSSSARVEEGRTPVKRRRIFLLAALAVLLPAARPLFAHHSMSMYDKGRSVTLKATITEFAWTNPHVQIHFQVQNENGVTLWMAECPSPSRLSKSGWSGDTLKPGDQITIIGNPAKDGSNEMRLDQVVLPSGQEITAYRR
jgi:hypothetical protein